MKNIIKIVSIGLVGFTASCSQHSSNNLGKRAGLTKGARPSAETLFNAKDTNKDGYLSSSEFQTKLGGNRGPSNRKAPTAEMQQKRFALLDTNSDQRISLAELKAAPAKPRKGQR